MHTWCYRKPNIKHNLINIIHIWSHIGLKCVDRFVYKKNQDFCFLMPKILTTLAMNSVLNGSPIVAAAGSPVSTKKTLNQELAAMATTVAKSVAKDVLSSNTMEYRTSLGTCSFKFACLKPKLFWVYIKSLLIFLVRRNLINSMFKLHGLIFSMKVIFSKNYFSVSVSNWNLPKNLITSLTNLEFSTYPECFIISWTVWGIP